MSVEPADDTIETSFGTRRITRARAEEAPQILRLRDDLARWMLDRGIEQWRPGELPLELFESWIAEGRVYVLRDGEALAGSVTVLWENPIAWKHAAGPAGYIHLLMVDRAYAGLGLGETLLAWAEEQIQRSGRSLIRLDCVKTNAWLRRYYERTGYQLVGYENFPDFPWALESALYEKDIER